MPQNTLLANLLSLWYLVTRYAISVTASRWLGRTQHFISTLLGITMCFRIDTEEDSQLNTRLSPHDKVPILKSKTHSGWDSHPTPPCPKLLTDTDLVLRSILLLSPTAHANVIHYRMCFRIETVRFFPLKVNFRHRKE